MVEIQNFSLKYGEKEILSSFNISINTGECVLFTGKSGSGKSSLINSINGLATRYETADIAGDIMVDGKNVKDLELYEISTLVSTVFQNPKTYFFNVNTTMKLLFYLENIGLKREEMEIRLKDMLEIFPITNLLNRDIFQLSGGEKQILCVAASYISGTKIIVMDEPSSNLDKKNIEILKHMLTVLKAKGISIIIAEHRIYYLMDIIDRVILLENGRINKNYSKNEFLKLKVEELKALGLRDKERTELKIPLVDGKGDFEIRNLSFKNIGSYKSLRLENLSFKLGKIYGIVGSNGYGKSTLLRCLIGVEKKSKEEIYFKGKRLSKKERLKNSAFVMQDVNHQLFTDEVSHELRLGVDNFDKEKAKNILIDLGLYDFKERHPMSLSGGQKQRVVIASIVCKDSAFTYFDEPTSGMDYTNMIKTSKLIKKYRNNDKIIFVVSHDIEFLNEVADAVYKIDEK